MSWSPEAVTWVLTVVVLIHVAGVVLFRGHRAAPRTPALPAPLKSSFLISAFCMAWLAARNFAYAPVRLGDAVIHVPQVDALPVRLFVFAGELAIPFLGPWATAASLAALAVARMDALVRAGHVLAIAVIVPVLVTHLSGALAAGQTIPWVLVALGALNGLMRGEDEGPAGKQLPAPTRRAERSPVTGPAASTAQRRGVGRLLVGLGWTAGGIGLLLAFSGTFLIKFLFLEASREMAERPVSVRLAVLVGVIASGGLLAGAGRAAVKRGRRHLRRTVSFDALDGQRYLLYLRPFSVDAALAASPEAPGWHTRSPFELPGLTQEAFVLRQFRDLGRVIAIGEPGERLPALGAERGYLPVDDWKDTVSSLIRGAHTVIMTASPGPGTVWEFTEAIRVSEPTRLLLLVYEEPAYYAFRDAAGRKIVDRSTTEEGKVWPSPPSLPNIPPPEQHDKGLRWDFPLTGILHFTIDRSARFTRFPTAVPRLRHVGTIRRLVRRELQPVLDHVSHLPAIVDRSARVP
ncbi:hypothetical protein [Actinokineospora fastidiosa]|uniref:Uncharacterized protein n=1 Tax=Actinokineospora fastidiosa TaxID=1816 RepID=A0A918GMI5_9PSEU|nr:hypothetical protein [Actinokineospora fastidiosa]GGS45246.1 hypothetical protein GCM10010171_45380 [Actinokineospora fastidiosa]